VQRFQSLFVTATLLSSSAVAFADAHNQDQKHVLMDTYQFGAAFEVVDANDVADCRLRCDSDVRCDAWSYLPETSDRGARCEVKFSIGKSTLFPGAVSGVSSRFDVTPIDMTLESELLGGPNDLPSQPSAKPEAIVSGPANSAGSAPRVYRGNELSGPANILTPPKDGETSPLLPALRGN